MSPFSNVLKIQLKIIDHIVQMVSSIAKYYSSVAGAGNPLLEEATVTFENTQINSVYFNVIQVYEMVI